MMSIGGLRAAGEVDAGFNPEGNEIVHGMAVQRDGQIVVGGSFSSMGGIERTRMARVGPDGSLDMNFSPSPSNHVYGIAVRPDGKLLVSGIFGRVNGIDRGRIALLDADGNLDSAFLPAANQTVWVTAIQADGKIVIGGTFTQVDGVTRNCLARLNADGSLDEAFNPDLSAAVRCVAIQRDGKIVIGGDFNTVNGVTRDRIARLNSDGSVDETFVATTNGYPHVMVLLADGKILVGGNFSSVGGVARSRLARLNTDGSLDTAFTDPAFNGLVRALSVQANGKVLVGGEFTTVRSILRNRLARLNADGSLDMAFDPNVNSNVFSLMLQKDGRILVGGVFTGIGEEMRQSLARLTNDAATDDLAVLDSSTIRWLRGGSSPEVNWSEFAVSMDGGTDWTALGDPSRISGGWELSGLSLPVSGYLRARGTVIGGFNTSSSWPLETMTGYHLTMVVEQPADVPLENLTSTVDFGPVVPGGLTTKTFTLRNAGAVPLTGLHISMTGAHSADFAVTTPPAGSLPAGESTTFTVTFTGPLPGNSEARLRLLSAAMDDAFDLTLTGRTLSFAADGDGDGLSDASELQMAALGFDWQVSQPELVGTLFDNAAKAGLYTEAQVQTLNVGARLITRDPVTQEFAVSVGLKKSTHLAFYEDLLLSAPMTTFMEDGRVEFRFTEPEETQFFKVEAQ